MLLTSSLFLACKIEDFYRPLDSIFKELANCISALQQRVPNKAIVNALGERDYSNHELTSSEVAQVANIEIDLLNAIGWNLSIDMPFMHINMHKDIFEGVGSQQCIDKLMNVIIRNLCLVVKSIDYLSYDIEIATIAAVFHGFNIMECPIPPNVGNWIQTSKARDEEQFKRIYLTICEKAEKCVKIC